MAGILDGLLTGYKAEEPVSASIVVSNGRVALGGKIV
jgi:hypothetical protein